MIPRHITVTLEWHDEKWGDMCAADIRDSIMAEFASLQMYLDADILITVSGR